VTREHDGTPRSLDAEALALFARKGCEAGPGAPQTGMANAVKVRRIMQLTRDLAGRPFEALRILDLGCGEGVYAIEAALRGAEVLALDARTERMALGAACAARHGLRRVRFVQDDVRNVSRAGHGPFDVVYLLGLLYHLDGPDLFPVLERVADVCTGLLLVDTLISLEGSEAVIWRERTYRGQRHREHADEDPDAVRRARVLRSIDNTWSFRLTRPSLIRALHDVGFTSVLEGHVPLEPGKAADRVTIAALRGTPVRLSTYPWINGCSEADIERRLLAEPTGGGAGAADRPAGE
jgi:SAM-dependent methyltransferase